MHNSQVTHSHTLLISTVRTRQERELHAPFRTNWLSTSPSASTHTAEFRKCKKMPMPDSQNPLACRACYVHRGMTAVAVSGAASAGQLRKACQIWCKHRRLTPAVAQRAANALQPPGELSPIISQNEICKMTTQPRAQVSPAAGSPQTATQHCCR